MTQRRRQPQSREEPRIPLMGTDDRDWDGGLDYRSQITKARFQSKAAYYGSVIRPWEFVIRNLRFHTTDRGVLEQFVPISVN
jgi:hypothetical protein